MDKRSMLEAMISHYTNGNKAKFAGLLGVSAQTISAWGTRNTFDHELIYTKCRGISADWLLTGEGSMLRSNESSEVKKQDNTVTSAAEESIVYKLYKEKDAEVGQLKEEIGALKLKLSQYISDEEQDHPKGLGDAKDASTKKSSSPNADSVTSATAQ